MQWVMCGIFECPYCQFCVFEDDCTREMKYEAREESKTDKCYYDKPSCFQQLIS